jgi:predicted TIM-barrel fold metal-dependent hydrolase
LAVQEAPRAAEQQVKLAVYDTDVHHGWNSKADLVPYVPVFYRERFEKYNVDAPLVGVSNAGGVRGYRADVVGGGKVPEGWAGVAAPNAELTREQLLDGCGVDWALLTGGPVGAATLHDDIDYANALISAFNDFTVEQWLAKDDRFRYALAINQRDPDAAVAEIERLGDHPGIVGVITIGGSTIPFGQRYYSRVHEACVERDLVWAIHFGSEGKGTNPAPTPAGHPSYYAEVRMHRPASYMAHMLSFIFEGVFERLPGFKLALLESGFSWVGPFLWSADQTWIDNREETPWVKRPPSEYVFESVRFASQPEDEPTPKGGLEKILEWMHAEQTLMFATDYPHWDWDDPAETFKTLPLPLKERIFSANAREFFRG